MRPTNCSKQSMKPIRKVFLARMLAEVDMTLMFTFMEVLVPISVEKNQHLSNHSKANPVDPD